MNNLFKNFSLTCTTVLLLATAVAQEQKENPYTIKVAGIQFVPPANALSFADSFFSKKAGLTQLLVQFYNMPTATHRAAVAESGISLKNYLGNNTFMGIVTLPVKEKNLPFSLIRSFTVMQPEWKIASKLLSQTGNTKLDVAIKWDAGATENDIATILKQANATIVDKKMWHLHVAVVAVAANKLKTLAAPALISYISPASQYKDLNFAARAANKVNYAGVSGSLGGYGLYGDSVTVGVGDNTSGKFHIDLLDRIINFNPAPYSGHGQHTNGTVGGAGIVDPKGEGMAAHVRIMDHLYDLVWIQTEGMRQNYNMTVTNNSYAAVVGDCGYAGTYDVYSEAVDNTITKYPDVLHIFAAGNDGYIGCPPYTNGFATVCGSYQASKNAVVVGNTDKEYTIRYTSSRGPVKDGRIKPEITAIGTDLYSCQGGDTYGLQTGTSMACPNVTGALAGLTQRYKQLHNNQNPPSDILKTILLNGTTDIGQPGPDYIFGFGRMNFYRSLQMIENNRYQTGTITQGAEQTFPITLPTGISRLKVMLYWHDTSASPAAATALVNDLDLEVTEPSNAVHHPIIPNPSATLANNPGTEGTDHLNNIEQVTINNPAAGSYVLKVKGYSLPSLTRKFVIAYDFEPDQINFTFPLAGSSWNANDSMYVYWEAPDDNNTLSLDFSINNGNTWLNVATGIAANKKAFKFLTPNINSEQCRFRLTRNGLQTSSAAFVIHQSAVVQIDSTRLCPGYFAIKWTPVPNATAYQVLRKKGFYLQPVDTVTGVNYTFSGLSIDSNYFATIVPFINGVPGFRSIAVSRTPNSGSCSGSMSDGDLMMEKIVKPTSGRLYTSTALKASDTIQLNIRNLDNMAVNGFTVHYKVNNGNWNTQAFTTNIPALGSVLVSIPGQDFSPLGSYQLTASVQNTTLTDNVQQNDTLTKTVRQLDNAPVNADLGNIETFDNTGSGEIIKDTAGLATNDRWDFTRSNDTGRLRFVTSTDIDITNNHSASMDVFLYTQDNQNYLTGTYNLSDYSKTTDEIRLEFDYKLHGKPKFLSGNDVWVRGTDQNGWVKVYTIDTTQNQGQIVNSGSLSLTNAMLLTGDDFSASTQVRFGQHDTSVIAANDYGNGTTLDNIQVYTVKNDVQLLGFITPKQANCNLGTTEQVTIKLYNGYNQPQSNVLLYYQADGGTINMATLPIIQPKDTLIFTFPQPADMSVKGTHVLNTWLIATGDTYHNNDSILQYQLYNLPFITTYPYLETFEQNNGNWYTAGRNTSWQWGIPAAQKINKAASGKKAWKTNLTGSYNTGESSYLYSPCFVTEGLSNPMLSFSMAMNIEHCSNPICDAAWLEYSANDSTWTKLTDNGFNWYGDDSVWNDAGFTRWHVASVSLPKLNKLRFRFVFTSDGGVNLEGLAIDDIHIYDKERSIYSSPIDSDIDNGVVTNNLMPNVYTDYTKNDKWLAQLNPLNKSLTLSMQYEHQPVSNLLANTNTMQYRFPMAYHFNEQTLTDSLMAKFYITDNDFVIMENDASCYYCDKPVSVYEMGLSYLTNNDLQYTRQYLDSRAIQWVPYDSGYYAMLKCNSPNVSYFSNGGSLGNLPYFTPNIWVSAQKIASENTINITWSTLYDTAIAAYTLERKYRDVTTSYSLPDDFDSIYHIKATNQILTNYTYKDINVTKPESNNPLTYRIKYVLKDGTIHYSSIATADWYEEGALLSIYPNPVVQNHFYVKWGGIDNQLEITIRDIAGRKVYYNIFYGKGSNTSEINLSPSLAKGIYTLRMSIGDKLYNHKIIVQ